MLQPVHAGWVEQSEDYQYGSARNYQELKGLIEMDPITSTVSIHY